MRESAKLIPAFSFFVEGAGATPRNADGPASQPLLSRTVISFHPGSQVSEMLLRGWLFDLSCSDGSLSPSVLFFFSVIVFD
jgi:hypothetical protein